jgi:hypothetical protein
VTRARRRRATYLAACAVGASLAALATEARAEGFGWDASLRVESDVRFRLEERSVSDAWASQGVVAGVERNQNLFGVQLEAGFEDVKAVAQIDAVVFGYQQEIDRIGLLTRPEETQPWRLDVNELYIDVRGLVFDDLDVRIGQQIAAFGVGDQFNPTNNLNPDDLRDPLLFGRLAGNFMARADYWVTEDLRLTGVLVPLFRPAMLPPTASLGPVAIDRLPFLDERVRWRVAAERAAAESPLGRHPTQIDGTRVVLPDPSFANMQAAFRIAGTVAEQDVALSYYRGRHDFPVPIANATRQVPGAFCGVPTYGVLCADGRLLTDVTLAYPEMHVYGLNASGEIPLGFLGDIPGLGWRLEAALVVPEEQRIALSNGNLDLGLIQIAEGEYDYDGDGVPGGGDAPLVVRAQPYLKWVLGLDYTFASSVYVNAQWVHGLPDEFGAGDWLIGSDVELRRGTIDTDRTTAAVRCALPRDGSSCVREIVRPRQADYLVLGVDVKFLDDQLLTRLFTIWDLSGYGESFYDPELGYRRTDYHAFYTPEGFSAVLFPEISYNFGNGLELASGALVQLGKSYTKFGDPVAGGSVAFARARYTL